jgi:hypothetical protein
MKMVIEESYLLERIKECESDSIGLHWARQGIESSNMLVRAEVYKELLSKATPLSEVVKPIIEDTMLEGATAAFRADSPGGKCIEEIMSEYLSKTLENLNK